MVRKYLFGYSSVQPLKSVQFEPIIILFNEKGVRRFNKLRSF